MSQSPHEETVLESCGQLPIICDQTSDCLTAPPTPPDITESLDMAPISRTQEKRLDLLWVGSQLSKVPERTRIGVSEFMSKKSLQVWWCTLVISALGDRDGWTRAAHWSVSLASWFRFSG